jgi:hypothetical protein
VNNIYFFSRLKASNFLIIGIIFISTFQSFQVKANIEIEDYSLQLSLIADIKKYCSEELGLQLGTNFYTKWEAKDGLLHYVYVSKNNEIAVPDGLKEYYYYGTNRKQAVRAAAQFTQKGYHTLVYQTAGTSATLLNKALMNYSMEAIAVIVFHEALHVHLRSMSRAIPLSIEEAAADVLAKKVTVEYLKNQDFIKKRPLKHILKTMEKIYKTINTSQTKIQNSSEQSNSIYKHCDKKIRKALRKGDNYQKTRFTYPINNAYFVRNSYYSEYYFTLDKLYNKLDSTKAFIQFVSDLPNNLDVSLLIIESKLSNLI